VLDFVQRLLLKQTPAATPDECAEQSRFVGKFQQITSPVAAKGLEDTALYSYNRLLSLNDVGSDPKRFGIDTGTAHQLMIERQQNWPLALSATATHDSKRGEDVRARLNVLSEIPGEWRRAVSTWRALNRRAKREIAGASVPGANEEYFLYQTLVGAWPFADDDVPSFVDRLKNYVVKALREAKVHTSWLAPDEQYEQAFLAFIDDILSARRPFLREFKPFQSRVSELGIVNGLAQLLIKMSAPGIPDFYQGSELWDLSLVDPDNRHPVNYGARLDALGSLPSKPDAASARALFDTRANGRVKLFTIARALAARNAARDVFERGRYVPLRTEGVGANSVFAFARTLEDGRAVMTCVPRLVAGRPSPPLGASCWEDTRIRLIDDLGGAAWHNVFTGETTTPEELALDVGTVLQSFPVALLTRA
jgi:(1->4)-alpha-D-glucan 1-alpha-D-glucosylmutase